jgi:folate-binding Fe-S cluster repair protein YgfZ
MKLYEITGAMAEMQKLIDEGVPPEQLEDTLNEIQEDFDIKAQSCLFAMANLNGEIETTKSEEARLNARRKSKEKQLEKLKDYVLFNMKQLGKSKVDNGTMTATVRKGRQIVSIIDENSIPFDYKKVNTSIAVDKKKLFDDLKDGAEIKGAALTTSDETLTVK